jgi:exopolysaccharide production protein ExoQ
MRWSGRGIQGVASFADKLSLPAAIGAAGVAFAILVGAALAGEKWFLCGVLMLVALVPLIMRWPVIVPFGLYALLLPFDTIEAGLGMTLTRPIGAVALAVLAIASLVERRLRRPPSAALWSALLLIWGIGSVLWAVDPALVLERVPTLLGIALLYIMAISFAPSREDFRWCCVLTVIGGTIAAAVASIFGVEDREGRISLALNEQLANANLFTAGLVTAIALAIGGVVALRGHLRRVMALSAAAVILFAIANSGSRSTFLAVMFMVLFLIYRLGFATRIVVPALALPVVGLVISDTLMNRIGLLFTGDDSTGSGRTDIWLVGYQALERFWLWGAGLGTFPSVYRAYQPLGPRIVPPSAHNAYLQVWTELGIVGLIILLAILFTQLRRVRRVRSAGLGGVFLPALEAACVGTLVLAFFGDIVWTKQFWWPWILLAWATSLEEDAGGAAGARAIQSALGGAGFGRVAHTLAPSSAHPHKTTDC